MGNHKVIICKKCETIYDIGKSKWKGFDDIFYTTLLEHENHNIIVTNDSNDYLINRYREHLLFKDVCKWNKKE